jgi:hypothetical protein
MAPASASPISAASAKTRREADQAGLLRGGGEFGDEVVHQHLVLGHVAGTVLGFSSAMMSGDSPALAGSGACANHSTCERHGRPMTRIANSLSLVGTEVRQRG